MDFGPALFTPSITGLCFDSSYALLDNSLHTAHSLCKCGGCWRRVPRWTRTLGPQLNANSLAVGQYLERNYSNI